MKKMILFFGLVLFLTSCVPEKDPCEFVDCLSGPYFFMSLEKNGTPYYTDNISLAGSEGDSVSIDKISSRAYYFVNPSPVDTGLILMVDDSLSFDLEINYELLGDSECCGPFYELGGFKVNGTLLPEVAFEQIGEEGYVIGI